MEIGDAVSLMKQLSPIPRASRIRPTFLELSGYPHYENVCSNILAFFLDPSEPHHLGLMVLDALLEAAEVSSTLPGGSLANVSVQREVPTRAGGRLDILIEADTNIIAIENKIWAATCNPFAEYSQYVEENKNGRHAIKILLGLSHIPSEVDHNFKYLCYGNWVEAIRSRLGQYVHAADVRYVVLLAELLETIDRLRGGSQLDPQWIEFFRDHGDRVIKLQKEIGNLRNEFRNKLSSLRTIVDAKSRYQNIEELGFWRVPDRLQDYLYFTFKIPDLPPVTVDVRVTPNGWAIMPFIRPNHAESSSRLAEGMCRLEGLLPRCRDLPRENERLVWKTFRYGCDIEKIAYDLDKLFAQLIEPFRGHGAE